MSEDPSRIKFKWSDANATRTMLSSALNKVSMVIRASGGVRPCLDVTSLPTRAQEIIHAAINGTPPPPRFTPEVDMTFVMCTLVPPGYTPGAEGPEYAVTHKDLRMYAEQLNRGNVPVLLDHDTGTEDPFGFVSSAHFNEKTGELTAVLALRGPNKKTGRSSALRHVKGGYRCVSLGVYKYPLININVAVDASLCVVPARDGADLYIKESALVNASTGVEETRVRAGKMDVLTFRLNDMKVEAATLKGESKGEGQKVEKQTGVWCTVNSPWRYVYALYRVCVCPGHVHPTSRRPYPDCCCVPCLSNASLTPRRDLTPTRTTRARPLLSNHTASHRPMTNPSMVMIRSWTSP